jgi:His-Xaa-Ser system radical SAM maturase HxsC
MKESKGTPHGIRKTQVLRITGSEKVHRKEKCDTALLCHDGSLMRGTFCITPALVDEKRKSSGLYGVPADFMPLLREGDVVKVEPDGRLTILWETAARHNALFITDCCNSRCIMCPQRPEERPRHHDDVAVRTLSLLRSDHPPAFAITGGEPTLAFEGLVRLLETCTERFPEASVQLLTNGRRCSDFAVASRIIGSSPRRLLFCIPLFADNNLEHDYITGASGSFSETINGIHNIVRHSRPVEIRVVIVRQNAKRLKDLAHFIFWNFPFAVHVAFMAMETSGTACTNLDEIWVEPSEYAEDLERAVLSLHQRMINVSIYNIPLCLLPEKTHQFARDSISDWKKIFLPECGGCSRIASCGGFFATSVRKPTPVRPYAG